MNAPNLFLLSDNMRDGIMILPKKRIAGITQKICKALTSPKVKTIDATRKRRPASVVVHIMGGLTRIPYAQVTVIKIKIPYAI